MSHTICVTGASGFVGRHVVRELLSRGHTVRVLVRDQAKADDVLGRHEALSTVVGDILDRTALDRLAQGSDACIHLVGIIRERSGGQTFDRMHVRATDAIVDACTRADIRRFVHMSALGVGAEGVCAYQRSKYEAELIVRASDLEWTIFRPGLIHGPGGEMTALIADWVRGKGLPGAFLPYFTRGVEDKRVILGPVHREVPSMAPVGVEDVAWCFVEALQREATIGEIYNVAGPDVMTFPQLLLKFRDAVPGAKEHLQPRGIPAEPAALGARIASMMKLDALTPFDEGMARMGAQDSYAALEKLEAHFGRTPAPFDLGYAASL